MQNRVAKHMSEANNEREWDQLLNQPDITCLCGHKARGHYHGGGECLCSVHCHCQKFEPYSVTKTS